MNNHKRTTGSIWMLMLTMLWFDGAAAASHDSPSMQAQEPDRQRRTALIRLVRQDCGSCHGMTLAGGLGPALLPENLRDKDRRSLKNTILFGRAGTPMPPWREFLTDDEAGWLVDRLGKGFPDAP